MSMTLDWLLVLGFAGQGCYGARFLIQWLASERRGESTIPVAFWYLSIAAALLLLVYAIARRDPVFIAGQSTGAFIYVRNLVLIQRRRTTSA
ncbi:MAG: lipid-A-disaccharide synthase N-terminal domain-containing protein [Gemmatimonadales bacterium]